MKQLQMKVANDNGNSTVKMIFDEGKVINSSNVYAKVRQIPNLEELDQEKFIDNIENNLVVAINSKEFSGTYFVGDYAKESGRVLHNMQLGIFGNKVESDIYPRTTLAHIAGQAVKRTRGKDDYVKVDVEMIGAIPIVQYSKEEANKLADKFLKATHMVTVHLPNNTVNVSIEFKVVKILPEGVPPVFYLHKKNEKYKGQRILHINIGEGTTELPITNDIRFNPNFIKGVNLGVGNAIERVLDEFKAKTYMSDEFSRQHFINIIQDRGHRFYNIARELLDDELETESMNIMRVALSEMKKANNELDYLFVYGGGSILMEEFLKEKVQKIVDNINAKLIYALPEDAVNIEVKGMKEFFNSNVYKKIKSKLQQSKQVVEKKQE